MKPPRPYLHRQGALLPARPMKSKFAKSWCAIPRWQKRPAPSTLKMLSQFSVLSRLVEPENLEYLSETCWFTTGENLKDTDPQSQIVAGIPGLCRRMKGMNGPLSTRWAFKILSKVFNFDNSEVAANPVHLLYVLEQQVQREQFPPEIEQKYLAYIKEYLAGRYVEFIGKEIQTAYLESYSNMVKTFSTAM